MSQSVRILAVLRDGKPHTCAEIHRIAGFSRLNSRVSELRKQGHVITCVHTGGVGPSAYVYTLSLLGGAESRDAGHETARKPLSRIALRSSEQAALPTAGKPFPPAACSPLQLELTVAA